MKKFIALTVFAGVVANAQNTTSAPATADLTSKPPSAAAGSVSLQEAEVAPKEARKVGALFISESYTSIDDVEKDGAGAPTWSISQIGLNYKLNDAWTVEARQTISTVTNRDKVAASSQAGGSASAPNNIHTEQAFEVLDPMIIAKVKTQTGILGSNALSHAFRYEIPVGKYSREQKRNGTLRYDTNLAWALASKVEANFAVSPRFIFGSADTPETSGTAANDVVYRLVAGPGITYNFNDTVGTYGALTFDHRSTDLNRARWDSDTAKLNIGSYEVGANINLKVGDGNLSLNPAISSDLDLNDRGGSVATEDSRFFAHETNTYYLAITATY